MVERVISLRRNISPGRITLHMKESFPISDKSSCFVHFFRVDHFKSSELISSRLSFGT